MRRWGRRSIAGTSRRLLASGADHGQSRAAPRRSPPPPRQLSTKPPLQRLYWALGRLRSSKPLKATDLAAEFEVNVRTAYRDLDFLRDQWNVPIEFDRAQGTYLLTEPTGRAPGR